MTEEFYPSLKSMFNRWAQSNENKTLCAPDVRLFIWIKLSSTEPRSFQPCRTSNAGINLLIKDRQLLNRCALHDFVCNGYFISIDLDFISRQNIDKYWFKTGFRVWTQLNSSLKSKSGDSITKWTCVCRWITSTEETIMSKSFSVSLSELSVFFSKIIFEDFHWSHTWIVERFQVSIYA